MASKSIPTNNADGAQNLVSWGVRKKLRCEKVQVLLAVSISVYSWLAVLFDSIEDRIPEAH